MFMKNTFEKRFRPVCGAKFSFRASFFVGHAVSSCRILSLRVHVATILGPAPKITSSIALSLPCIWPIRETNVVFEAW